MTRETLIKYNFVDNEYLTEYLNLVNNSISSPENYCEAHHIIPACFYPARFVANQDPNQEIVNLVYKDHIKAHGLLTKCTTERKLLWAFEYMLKMLQFQVSDIPATGPTAEQLDILQARIEKRYADWRENPHPYKKHKKHKCSIKNHIAEQSKKCRIKSNPKQVDSKSQPDKEPQIKELEFILNNQKIRGYGLKKS